MSDETFVIDTGSNLIKEDKVEPFPSLSDSKASEVEISAIADSLKTIPN